MRKLLTKKVVILAQKLKFLDEDNFSVFIDFLTKLPYLDICRGLGSSRSFSCYLYEIFFMSIKCSNWWWRKHSNSPKWLWDQEWGHSETNKWFRPAQHHNHSLLHQRNNMVSKVVISMQHWLQGLGHESWIFWSCDQIEGASTGSY